MSPETVPTVFFVVAAAIGTIAAVLWWGRAQDLADRLRRAESTNRQLVARLDHWLPVVEASLHLEWTRAALDAIGPVEQHARQAVAMAQQVRAAERALAEAVRTYQERPHAQDS